MTGRPEGIEDTKDHRAATNLDRLCCRPVVYVSRIERKKQEDSKRWEKLDVEEREQRAEEERQEAEEQRQHELWLKERGLSIEESSEESSKESSEESSEYGSEDGSEDDMDGRDERNYTTIWRG